MRLSFLLWVLCIVLVSCSRTDETSMSQEDTSSHSQISQKQVILALWDSLTAWYGLQISESYPSKLENILQENEYNYRVINAGVSGDTSQNLLQRAELYTNQNPDIVLLVIGWNDGLRGLSTQDLKRNIQTVIDMYKLESKIVLWGMEIPANLWWSYTKSFKDVYFQLAQENPDIYFLESFLKDVGWVPRLNQSDRIHPTSEWYDIIVANLYEFLEKRNIIEK